MPGDRINGALRWNSMLNALFWTSAAWASAETCPGDHDSIPEAFEAHWNRTEAWELEVGDGCAAGEVATAWMQDMTVTCVATKSCTFPAVYAIDSTVVMTGGEFPGPAQHWVNLPAVVANVGSSLWAVVYAENSQITLGGNTFPVGDGSAAAVAVFDSTLHVSGSTFDSYSHAIKAVTIDEKVDIAISDTTITNSTNTGIYANSWGSTMAQALSLDHVDFTRNAADDAADMLGYATDTVIEDCTFTGGTSAALASLSFGGTNLSIRHSLWTGNSAPYGAIYVMMDANIDLDDVSVLNQTPSRGYAMVMMSTDTITVEDSAFELGGLALFSSLLVSLEDNQFTVRSGNDSYPGIEADNTYLSLHRNEFCGDGAFAHPTGGLIVGYNSRIVASENIFHGLTLRNASLIGPYGDATSSYETLSFTDNTLVDVKGTALYSGEPQSLDVRNNLYSDAVVNLDITSMSDAWLWSHNLYDVDDAVAIPDDPSNVIVEDALFSDTYVRGACRSLPSLDKESKAIGTGSEDLASPDIGAVDFGAEDEWEWGDHEDTGDDTGDDAGDDDLDGDGTPNDLDCAKNNSAVHPGAIDLPDDELDQDCDGFKASTSFGGGCDGCSTQRGRGGAALFGAVVAALLTRRRHAA